MKQKNTTSLALPLSALGFAGGLGLIVLAGLARPSAVSAATVLGEITLNIGVDAGPPPPPREVIVASPGPGFIWVGGYWDGEPGHYRWVGGHWGRPPHDGARWIAPRWERDHDGHYHRVEGGWR